MSRTTRVIDILVRNQRIYQLSESRSANIKRLKDYMLWKYVEEVYRDLGGKQDLPPIDLLAFCFETSDACVTLYEESDFNRYRAITLRSEIYDKIDHYPLEAFRRYSRQNEKDCLKTASHKAMWTNSIAEKHFGISEECGDLGGNGSAAWKLRAFQLFLTELYTLLDRKKLCAISIYDRLLTGGELTPLKTLLDTKLNNNDSVILKHIQRTLTKQEVPFF